ncbi:hypothetical protein WS81_12120 [Burkholderia sp. MSMB2040]|nr:hypothetical protein WS81_12120 [Burkholderia sp. MSMB2040]
MARLSTREVSVLRYLARGHSNQEIAAILNISHKTVSTHKSKIIVKLGISNLVDLAAFASANHII